MIALYRGVSPASRVIEWVTRGPYSHAAWVCRNGRVIEARFSGVRSVESIDAEHTDGTPVELYEIPGCDAVAAERFLEQQIGKLYDYRTMFGFFTRTHDDNPWAWICSELVFAAIRAGGVDLLKRVEAWKVSPTMLSYSPVIVPFAVGRTMGDRLCGSHYLRLSPA